MQRHPTAERLAYTVPPAIVVGVCGHGLATIRALHGGGMPIVALETSTRPPGTHTRLARVELVPDLNGPGLIDALLALRERISCPRQPVLFLTNDTMVRTVGQHWSRLEGRYALSWSQARDRLTPLLDKPALESRCQATGVAYPGTFLLNTPKDAERAAQTIGFPMIAKPARPLSRFKTAQPDSPAALRALAERFAGDLPFLVQQFIPGDDTSIYFCAFYLDRGQPLARFDGHKIRSRPLGHTSIAEPLPNEAVHAEALRFFAGLDLSGPVSLELKQDPVGRLWVIEPTVGRTDFWLGLCTANGVNLPLIEYRHQTGMPFVAPAQDNSTVWFNEDRDPLGRLWLGQHGRPGMLGRRSAFLFLHLDDLGPTRAFLAQTLLGLATSVYRRLRRLLG